MSNCTGGNQEFMLFGILLSCSRGQKSPEIAPGSVVHILCILGRKGVHLVQKKTCFQREEKFVVLSAQDKKINKKINKKIFFF